MVPNRSGYLGCRVRRMPTFGSWKSMMYRCYNPGDKCFSLYGGRGITVCDRWHDFYLFLEDMGLRPEGYTLDRIDPDGNYGPDNCRWATLKEQGRNRRNSRRIEFNGETKTLVEWGELYGVAPEAISRRILRGWSVEKSITTKSRHGYKQYSGFGKSQGVRQWADEYGLPCQVIKDRIRKGWSIEEAVTTPVANYKGPRPQWWKSRYGYRIGDEGHKIYKADVAKEPRECPPRFVSLRGGAGDSRTRRSNQSSLSRHREAKRGASSHDLDLQDQAVEEADREFGEGYSED